MDLKFLGDAADHWKGSVLEWLRAEKAVQRLHVVPMLTSRWDEAHLHAYARFLRVKRDSVLDGLFTHGTRGAYFQCARNLGGDVFLDPDSGLRDGLRGTRKRRENYVLLSDLLLLSPEGDERLVLVYDETRDYRNAKQQHIERIGGLLAGAGYAWCAYDSGRSLSLFVLARREERVAVAKAVLSRLLGPCAEGLPVPQGPNRLYPIHQTSIEGGA